MTEDNIGVIVERIENLKTQVSEGQERAEKWREHFDQKLDNRPCERHAGFFRTIDIQLKAIWAFIGAIIVAIVTEYLKR